MADALTNDSASPQENGPTPIPENLARFSFGPSTVQAMITRAADAEEYFKEFNNRLARAEIALDQRTEKKVAEVERLSRSLNQRERQRIVEQEKPGLRREVDRETEASRWEVLKSLKRAEEEILAVESQYATPAVLLAREGLGSDKRSRYLEQLSHSGPAEVRNFAAHAVATKDKVLGAAVLSRLDALNKRDRDLVGVTRQELAEALVGADFQNAQAAIARVKNRLREALNANRAFSTGSRRLRAQSKIAMGLRRGAEKGASDD